VYNSNALRTPWLSFKLWLLDIRLEHGVQSVRVSKGKNTNEPPVLAGVVRMPGVKPFEGPRGGVGLALEGEEGGGLEGKTNSLFS
jgi:hypothetical protein